MEYLVFWVICEGVKPLNKGVEAITNMMPQTSKKEVRVFIGLLKYY